MRLELFNYIDETIEYVESRKEFIDTIAEELEKFLMKNLEGKDYFLNISKRIKAYSSLKEKILRNNLYVKYKTPEALFEKLSDLIGLRIGCRFIEDEKKVYKDLLNIFTVDCGDGFYSTEDDSSIQLLLSEKQPKLQKNGFEIYKIDGKYVYSNKSINFELQIKSLVNEFWGEIDHRVLYKNFNYMLTENFFHDIMFSIKDNLSMIDKQLMVVYEHLSDLNASSLDAKDSEVRSMTSKLIHDVYITKIKSEIGFLLDFKKSTELIVDYLFDKHWVSARDAYSESLLRILNKTIEVSNNEIALTTYLEFEREPKFNDVFTERFGNAIIRVINNDFRWNLFFRIILDIESEMNIDDFEGFVKFIKNKYLDMLDGIFRETSIDKKLQEDISNSILETLAEAFEKSPEIDNLIDVNMIRMEKCLHDVLIEIRDGADWADFSEDIVDMIARFEYV